MTFDYTAVQSAYDFGLKRLKQVERVLIRNLVHA